MGNLTHKGITAISEPGMYGDGDGLWLKVSSGGSRSWVLRVAVHGRRREFGLGSVKLVSLADARSMAREMRREARQGGNPETARNRKTLTFRDATGRVYASMLPTWKSQRHAEIWWRSMELHAFPVIGDRAIETLGPADVLEVLSPIWTSRNDTARRIRQRLSGVFDWAKTAGHYGAENPVNGIARALPKISRVPDHMKSLHWQKLPALMAELRLIDSTAARFVEFTILTAARSGEARSATWAELDGDLWTVPADRMKMGKPHRVPLCEPALGALERVRGLDPEIIFPSRQRRAGARRDTALTVNTGPALLRRMGYTDITLHGFRSTFRDWCSEHARADREVAEAALSHATGTAVERAYHRSDLFDRRRSLMEAWGRFCGGARGDVVELARGG